MKEAQITQALTPFHARLKQEGFTLTRDTLTTLQINLGKRCNQACHHCHVEAGPNRTENMERETVDRIITLLDTAPSVNTLDLTGGAPELNPHFRYLVEAATERNIGVIDRCNLTVLHEPGQEDTAHFLRNHQVTVVASLPCYSKENVEKQRGKNVFTKSIESLQTLNQLGYGKPDSGLELHLVYNPLGAFLPPPQVTLEEDYKKQLKEDFDISFNSLFTITNMPIKRFRHMLEREGTYDEYMHLLEEHFNTASLPHVMCKSLLSIGWDGALYDCDFNQMLEMPIKSTNKTLWTIESFQDVHLPIALANHCYGCTAGAGSSCGGTLTD